MTFRSLAILALLASAPLVSACSTTCTATADKLALLRRGMSPAEATGVMGCPGSPGAPDGTDGRTGIDHDPMTDAGRVCEAETEHLDGIRSSRVADRDAYLGGADVDGHHEVAGAEHGVTSLARRGA